MGHDPKATHPTPGRSGPALIGVLLLMAVAVGLLLWVPAEVAQTRSPAPPELPPLPVVQFPAARPMDVVQATYEFAARHPEVLRYAPCYCGCQAAGHGGNEDCFISDRHEDGTVVWDAHAIGCGVCIDVARDAMEMSAAGATVTDIRAALDRKYRDRFGTSTPTPMAPSR